MSKELLNKTQLESLKTIFPKKSYTAKDHDLARTDMLAFLSKNDVDGVDGDTTGDLIDFCLAFAPAEAKTTKTVEKKSEKQLIEEAADEDEDEEDEDEEDEDEEDEDEDEDYEEEEEADDEDGQPAPAKKAAVVKKQEIAKKPAPQTETKPKVTAPVAVVNNGGTMKLVRGNKHHEALITDFLGGFFTEVVKEDELDIKILKQGATVRLKLKNSEPTIMNFDGVKIVGVTGDGTKAADYTKAELTGDLYFNRLKNKEELIAVLDESELEYDEDNVGMFRGESHPSIRKVDEDEITVILTDSSYIKEALKRSGATDISKGKNREKLEDKVAEKNEKIVSKKKK